MERNDIPRVLTEAPFHYALPVDEELFREGLFVTNIGWEQIKAGQPYPNPEHPPIYYFQQEEGRVLPAFTLVWVIEGKGVFKTEKEQVELSAGMVFLIRAGEWHTHHPNPETGWAIAWMEFNGNIPFQWAKNGLLGKDSNLLSVRNLHRFAQHFGIILEEARDRHGMNGRGLSLMAAGLLGHVIEDRTQTRKHASSGDPIVDKAVECIWNYSHGLINVDKVAELVGVNRRALERRFERYKGYGILDEIHQCRFERAAELLAKTRMPVKNVVIRAGFGSHEQFRKVFLRYTGLTPRQYRKKAQLNSGKKPGAGTQGVKITKGLKSSFIKFY